MLIQLFSLLREKRVILLILIKRRQTNIDKLWSSIVTPYLWNNSWAIKISWNVKIFYWKQTCSSNQSGFKIGHSCINQLVSITHEIYKSFDEGHEVRGVFLDISKAFDRVWHVGIIFKLIHFLYERRQRVVLNGQASAWKNVTAGVLKGSILGLLLFLIYINDLSEGIDTNTKLFADNTSLSSLPSLFSWQPDFCKCSQQGFRNDTKLSFSMENEI